LRRDDEDELAAAAGLLSRPGGSEAGDQQREQRGRDAPHGPRAYRAASPCVKPDELRQAARRLDWGRAPARGGAPAAQARMQAAQCAPPTSRSGGTPAAQSATAIGQRGWNAQPAGGSSALGT